MSLIVPSNKVSIGVLAFNRAHLLERALRSLLKQTYVNLEIIISDDNSKDNTEEVVAYFKSTDSRIKYVKRSGIGMTQNFVATLASAQGEYFMWLCDDDYVDEDYVELCLNCILENPDYALVCGQTRFVNNGEILSRREKLDLEQDNDQERVRRYFRYVNSNIILYGLMRRQQILSLFYPDTFCADLLWSCQIVFLGKVKIISETSFYYSVNGISQQTSGLQEYYQTTRNRKINPYIILRKELIKLIVAPTTVFNQLSLLEKIKFILRLWFILRERFIMPRYEARLRGILKVRTRIRALFG